MWPLTVLAGLLLCIPIQGVTGEWFPDELVYDPYLASQRTIQMKLGAVSVDRSDIPGASDRRYDVRIGQRAGLYRWSNGWQVSGFAGFNGLFDIARNTDSIGWDGRYGLTLATEWLPGRSLKLESRHQSAHVGDEFIARTGRKRIGYTREELNVGYSHAVVPLTRAYVETGWAWGLREKSAQDPWRIQFGAEYGIGPDTAGKVSHRSGPFIALDLESMEERDWNLDVTLQAGWFLIKNVRLWRAVIEYRHGRVPLGEFSGNEEEYLSVSLSMLGR